MSAILDTYSNRATLTYCAVTSALAFLALVFLPVPILRAAVSPASATTSTVTEPGWGEPVEGLSVQLWAERAVWDLAQPHHFRAGVRNQGRETFSVARTQVAGELEVDGVWYAWSNPIYVTFTPLPPGDQIDNIPVNTYGPWRKDLNVLTAGTGKHTIRFAVLARREHDGQVIRAVSRPIEVEFRWAANATNPPVTFIPGDAAVIADIQGRVQDDETGKPVTDFWVQAGVANLEKPDEFVWSQSYRGPIITGPPGRFALQAQKAGQAWRILADGYLPQLVLERPVVADMQSLNLSVRLKRGGELHGIVLDYTGQPVAGARVFLTTAQTPDFTDGTPGKTFRGSSASTDATGRFALRGVGEAEPKVVVVSADGLQVCPAPQSEPGQDLKITLPKPAALIVRYSVPGDEANAELSLTLWASESGSSGWNGVRTALKPTVPNGGQIVLTNLVPGRYELYRTKMLHAAGDNRSALYERRTIVLDAGQTQQVDLVRSVGHPVQGNVTGLDQTNATGGYIYVRSAIATGNPRNIMEGLLPCFDALTFGADGVFQTARLEPGTYTIAAHVYGTQNIDGHEVRVFRTGWRLPDYFGTTKLTVTAADPPPPIKIELHSK